MSHDFSSWVWYFSYISVLLGLAGYGCYRWATLYLYFKHGKKRPQPDREFSREELPLVTVQLPVFNEMHVVDRLLDAVSKLDYPQEKLEIQILDDSTDETTEISMPERPAFGRRDLMPSAFTAPTAQASRPAHWKTA